VIAVNVLASASRAKTKKRKKKNISAAERVRESERQRVRERESGGKEGGRALQIGLSVNGRRRLGADKMMDDYDGDRWGQVAVTIGRPLELIAITISISASKRKKIPMAIKEDYNRDDHTPIKSSANYDGRMSSTRKPEERGGRRRVRGGRAFSLAESEGGRGAW